MNEQIDYIKQQKQFSLNNKQKNFICHCKTRKMMNVRNFHLKSAYLNFSSETLNNQFNKQVIKSSKQKMNRCFPKTSQRVETLMKNFKLASKSHSIKENNQKNNSNNTHFDFQPPSLQSHRNKTANNMSCTLSPKKSTQKLSSFQLYKTGFKENHHKRRFSDTSFLKSRREKGLVNNNAKQTTANPQGNKNMIQNLINHQQFNQFQINQLSSKVYGFNKSTNKIKVFQIDNYFNHNHDQKVIHSAKNSSFITTLPTKRKSFRTPKSSSLKERRPRQNFSLQKTKKQMLQIQTKMSLQTQNQLKTGSQLQQKYEDFKRSIHTAGSVTARRIGFDKSNFTPISSGFFPQSSIWQKEQQFSKNSQSNKSRIYRVKEKESPSKIEKQKDTLCRPWSPGRPQNNRIPFQDLEDFPCINQD